MRCPPEHLPLSILLPLSLAGEKEEAIDTERVGVTAHLVVVVGTGGNAAAIPPAHRIIPHRSFPPAHRIRKLTNPWLGGLPPEIAQI